MISVVENSKEWNAVLRSVTTHDVYHTYEYHEITKRKGEQPILVVYEHQNTLIALPLILKAIRDTEYNDATSAYGYCGPITRGITSKFNGIQFGKELSDFLNTQRVTSVFSRLNPFIPHQEEILAHSGRVSTMGKLVNIDLTKDLDCQKRGMNSRLKTYINASRKKYIIRKANDQQEIKEFVSIYYENMLRVNANDNYFFPGSYFSKLWHSKDFNAKFLLAFNRCNGEMAGGAIFTMVNNIVQYHLSGAKKEYLKLNPIKVLIDDMRIQATKEGFSYFNLGGGVGNQNDSLFRFKSGFSKDFRTFKVWKYIVDHKTYDQLVEMKQLNCGYDKKTCQRYFPCYRCNLSTSKA